MRKPKQPGTKGIADEKPPPGGRALERVRQFAIQRGLSVPDDDAKESAKGNRTKKRGETTKRAAKRLSVKSKSRAKTKK